MIDPNIEFPDVMCDIETTGLNVGSNAIIQIAAVRFNLQKNTVDGNVFDMCLTIPPTRWWQEGTREWWLKDKRELLQSILSRGQDPRMVIQAFYQWASQGGSSRRFWGKPTHFDFAYLQNYLEEFGYPMPFHYRAANDMNSWIRARYWPNEPPNLEASLDFQGEAHNALHDVFHQIKVLFAHRDATQNQLVV